MKELKVMSKYLSFKNLCITKLHTHQHCKQTLGYFIYITKVSKFKLAENFDFVSAHEKNEELLCSSAYVVFLLMLSHFTF